MKKFRFTWTLIGFLIALLLLTLVAMNMFAQQDSTAQRPQPCVCPCDSAFMRLAAYRFERNREADDRIVNRILDIEESQNALERRFDTLRAIVREWSERQAKTKKSRKR